MRFVVGPLLLDTGRRILYRDGQALSVAPKAIDILIVLVEEAGQVVPRDTLRERVWNSTFVEDANVTKNVGILRTLLAEQLGPEVEAIRTIPKRGYQFTVPVESERPSSPSVPVAEMPSAEPLPSEPAEMTPEPVRTADPYAPPLPPVSPKMPWARYGLAAVVIIAVTALNLMLPQYLRKGPRADPAATPAEISPLISAAKLDPLPPAGRPALAVLDFANLGPESDAWLGTGVREILSARLADGPMLRLIDGARVTQAELDLGPQRAAADAATLSTLRRRLDANLVISGVVRLVDAKTVHFEATLAQAGGDRTLASASDTLPLAQLPQRLTVVAAQFRHAAGLPDAATTPLDSSLAGGSLKQYATGVAALQRSQFSTALKALEAVAESSPSSVLAHSALASGYNVIGSTDRAAAEGRLTLTLINALPAEARLLHSARAYLATDAWPLAIATLEHLARLRPDNPDYALELALAQIHSGDARGGLKTLKALDAHSAADTRVQHAASLAHFQLYDWPALLESSQAEVRLARTQGSASAAAAGLIYEGYAYWRMDRPADARAVLNEALTLSAASHDRWNHGHALYRLAGLTDNEQAGTAIQYATDALADYEAIGYLRGEIDLLSLRGMAYQHSGHASQATRDLQHSVEIATTLRNVKMMNTTLERAVACALEDHDLNTAEEQNNKLLEVAQAIGYEQDLTYALLYRGDIALERHQIDEARTEYSAALEHARHFPNGSSLLTRSLSRLEKLEAVSGNSNAERKWHTELSSLQAPHTLPQ